MDKVNLKGVAAGIVAGAAVGAGLALLFAPQSGRKTRREIQKRADELKVRADNFVASIRERDEAFCRDFKEGAENYRKEMLARIG